MRIGDRLAKARVLAGLGLGLTGFWLSAVALWPLLGREAEVSFEDCVRLASWAEGCEGKYGIWMLNLEHRKKER